MYCGVGLVKLFGSACRSEPAEILSKFDRFASYVLSAVDTDVNSSVVGVAVETVGFIGSTEDGKRALEQQGVYHRSLTEVFARNPKHRNSNFFQNDFLFIFGISRMSCISVPNLMAICWLITSDRMWQNAATPKTVTYCILTLHFECVVETNINTTD